MNNETILTRDSINLIFEKHYPPYLKGFDFEFQMREDRMNVYANKSMSAKILTRITISPSSSAPSTFDVFLKSDKFQGMWRLSELTDVPMTASIVGGFEYYFDNENEFVGIMDHTLAIFDSWVMDWLLDREYTGFDLLQELKDKYEQRMKIPDLENRLREQMFKRFKPTGSPPQYLSQKGSKDENHFS